MTKSTTAAKLAHFRQVAAPQAARCRMDLEKAWRQSMPALSRNTRFAPALPVTLTILLDPVTANTFTAAQTIIGASQTGPFSADYFKAEGASWEQEAMGIIGTTATPTIIFGTYFGVVAATITTVLAVSPTQTTISGLANVDWYYKVFGRTVTSTGSTSTIIVTGFLISQIATAAANNIFQLVKNATPPTAVTADLSSAVFLDLKATWSASSASNTITTNYYKLASLFA
jgi:hypothetical protein